MWHYVVQLAPLWWQQQISTRLYGITLQMMKIFIVTAIGTSHLLWWARYFYVTCSQQQTTVNFTKQWHKNGKDFTVNFTFCPHLRAYNILTLGTCILFKECAVIMNMHIFFFILTLSVPQTVDYHTITQVLGFMEIKIGSKLQNSSTVRPNEWFCSCTWYQFWACSAAWFFYFKKRSNNVFYVKIIQQFW